MHTPEDWLSIAKGLIIPTLWALVGRVVAHYANLRLGRRRIMRLSLLWEVPVAIGMGKVGVALADLAGLMDRPDIVYAACFTAAYMGPQMLENLIMRLADKLPLGKR